MILSALSSTSLATIGLLNTGYSQTGCPPIITNGKLHGILPVVNQCVTYSDVVDCGTVTQADLFRRTRLWVAQSGHSPGDMITLSDKETGDIVGRFTLVITGLATKYWTNL